MSNNVCNPCDDTIVIGPSVRQVRVIATEDIYPSDEPGDYYIGPGRTDVLLEGVNCTVEQFLDWFLETTDGQDFIRIPGGMSDIGGSLLETMEGSLLSVAFDERL